MRRSFFRIACVAVALPGLLALQAQSAPRIRCSELTPYDRMQIAPVLIGPGARGAPVPVADRAVFAQDFAQTAEEGWRLPAELRVSVGEPVLIYPAGLEVAPERVDQPNRVCLPSWSTREGDWLEVREPCLIDQDKDGEYERVELAGWNPAMHVIRKRLIAAEPLLAPIRLVPNPAGLSASRVHHHRQLMMHVQPDRLVLLVHYGSHRVFDRSELLSHDGWQEEARGVQRYQAPPSAPAITVDQGEIRWDGMGLATWGQVTVPLDADRVISVAGQRIRVARAGEGWTLQLVEDRARPWVRLVCGGRKHTYKIRS